MKHTSNAKKPLCYIHHVSLIGCAIGAMILAAGCEAEAPRYVAPPLVWTDCELMYTASDSEQMLDSLKTLYRQSGGREILIVNNMAFRSECSQPVRVAGDAESARVGGAGESARVGGVGESARVGGEAETARVGGAGESARVAGAGESARVDGAGESPRVAGASESARVGGVGESARVAGAEESARIAGAGESARIEGAGESARVGGTGESARVGGAAQTLQCTSAHGTRLGYIVRNPIPAPLFVFDGVQLWRMHSDGRTMTPTDSLE